MDKFTLKVNDVYSEYNINLKIYLYYIRVTVNTGEIDPYFGIEENYSFEVVLDATGAIKWIESFFQNMGSFQKFYSKTESKEHSKVNNFLLEYLKRNNLADILKRYSGVSKQSLVVYGCEL